MTLGLYKKKRNFSKTSEPEGAKKKARPRTKKKSGELQFVVQEHHASHLHWDFRLELDGVLKSWAVPKGPPETPKEKRLAVQVEDHPLDYAKFEGSIPKGEYGGGEVYIWDSGTWTPEKAPHDGLKKGRLEFALHGDRLHGSYVLIRTRQEKNWLLIKRSHDVAVKKPATKSAKRAKAKTKIIDIDLHPQLALLVDEIPEGEGWIHEIKYDGYRILTKIENGKSNLFTRNGLDWTHKFSNIAAACGKLNLTNAVFDGEIVGIDARGRSDFHTLQEALKTGETDSLVYYVFDLLALNGEDLRERPLHERKTLLTKVLRKVKPPLFFSEFWKSHAKKLFAQSCELGLEGVISKREDSIYSPGRGREWVKSKCVQNEEFVIVGYTLSEKMKGGFGALILAARDEKSDLVYVGRVGTGFDQKTMKDLLGRMKKLSAKVSALKGAVPESKNIQWIKPKLIAQVQFAEWTHDQILRHASFLGLREDKAAKDVKIDKPTRLLRVETTVSHPDRVIFPKTKITKQDLADFYQAFAPKLLKAIEKRPLSLMRCPQGVGATCFFQKHLPEKDVISIKKASDLTDLVQMGTIELHAWNCTLPNEKYADQIVFDLDPDPSVPWKNVVACALELKGILEHLKLKTFLKVTGGKGLHIHVPVAPIYTFEQAKAFSKTICAKLEKTYPSLYTTNTLKANRKGKILLDYLRNGEGATAVAPYSVRARDGAPVALPISWTQLTTKLRPDQFTISVVLKLKKRRDPWGHWAKAADQKISILKPGAHR